MLKTADSKRDIAGINKQLNHVCDTSSQILASAQDLSEPAAWVKKFMDKFKI